MREIFLNKDLQKEFDENGFVKISFLEMEILNELRAYYESNFMHSNNHLFSKNFNRDYAEFSVVHFKTDFKKLCFDFICKTFNIKINNTLKDYKPVIANFIAKYPKKGILPFHQNWALVDEASYSSISVWCPLQSTNKSNGTLRFIKGSHKVLRGERFANTNERFKNVSDAIIEKLAEDIDVDFGEAIILDDAIIHGSRINKTESVRLAVQQILIPNELTPRFSQRNNQDLKGHGKVFEVNNEFFFHLENLVGNHQYAISTRDILIESDPLSDEQFLDIMKRIG